MVYWNNLEEYNYTFTFMYIIAYYNRSWFDIIIEIWEGERVWNYIFLCIFFLFYVPIFKSSNFSFLVGCECNNKADRCYFDEDLYQRTGRGGHCVDCRDNTDGPHCERCKDNHFLKPDDNRCTACECNPTGKVICYNTKAKGKLKMLNEGDFWYIMFEQIVSQLGCA